MTENDAVEETPEQPTPEERLAADPGLEPELAHERDAAATEETAADEGGDDEAAE